MSAESTSSLEFFDRRLAEPRGWLDGTPEIPLGALRGEGCGEPSNRGRDGLLILIDYLVIMDYAVISGEGD
jgi:hypothetical protein